MTSETETTGATDLSLLSLPRAFFARPTPEVARALVGVQLWVSVGAETVAGRVVETEAYLGADDPASHAAVGVTPRSAIMFGPPGITYVYIIYGMHHCLNFVTEAAGTAGAVLVRAMEPQAGRDLMASRRGLDPVRARDKDLCAGPGRLCRALGIDLGWNGLPLFGPDTASPGDIRIIPGEGPPGGPAATPRIGIRQAKERLHRFVDAGSHCLSA